MDPTLDKRQGDGGKTVAAYLAALPKDSRAALQKLRKDIRAAAPGATELIAWDMPAFKQGRLLVGYAALKDHCSLFPMSLAVMRDFAEELKGYSLSKGTIRFPAAEPLPTSLVSAWAKPGSLRTKPNRLLAACTNPLPWENASAA